MTEPDRSGAEVSMRAEDVRSLAENLRADAERFQSEAARIAEGIGRGAVGDRVYGADSRNVPAVQAINAYADVSEDAGKFMVGVGDGLMSMSRCARAVVNAFGDQDGLNAAGVDDVRRVLNLSEPDSSGGES
ncbi:MAG: hypothetical protein ACRDXX_10550 [Stackebrandtia sp.]